ncbi:D-arabinono-1,4-lactone oxidase [Cryobacterium sp. CG_9.6]|uniref:D-arabinono-1,4-lactone oxidase n=1 Tax=Cryobacterium sp. CG_9.6 TaxID=2760710 RepID=UPI00247426F6|nr:D-arabinono-1,4-lactone oxidase [Cryobacterium sp. CG_9.6]MDH6236051.1 FAD-linked oxidoreductase [Cryobacterium sp. CG_9.6]
MILRTPPWRNWARTESVRPVRVERPATVPAVQRAVRAAARAGLPVKAVGTGHSFTGIALAPGVQLDLHDLCLSGENGEPGGVLRVDTGSGRVTVTGGLPLHRLIRLLATHNLTLTNLGDIDRQTVAGAISTGTHGTGGRFAGLASQVVALTLVIGDGSVLRVSATENAELLPAARLGLGALGIIVDVTLQCVPSFVLNAEQYAEDLDHVLATYLQRCASTDHFEFFWFPHTDVAMTKTNTRLAAAAPGARSARVARWIDDEVLANGVYRAVCDLGTAIPALVPPLARISARATGNREFTDASARVFATSRTVRFRELEYALPRKNVPDAVRAVRALIEARGWRISFPVEVRCSAADDLWLSTATGRETGYISVHRYIREDPDAYFRAVEQIMLEHGGRPHWGKLHYQNADALRESYPHFDDFLAVRDRLDPERRFTNSYLKRVLGP